MKLLHAARLSNAASPLWTWMAERHTIYQRKTEQQLERPWTKDKILQTYRFCNVYRELDTTTIWIRKHWREKMKRNPNLPFAMLVARMINRPSTLATITEKCGLPEASRAWCNHAHRVLATLVNSGVKIYGGAYIITAGGQEGPKYDYTANCLREAAATPWLSSPTRWSMSLEHLWAEFRELPGCGPFIAYEIATDLRWTRFYNGKDHMTWANPGPGAMRGINRILTGEANGERLPRGLYIETMVRLTAMANEHRDLKWMPRFEVRDIEHSLCETDKYLRAKHGEGRPKQRYT
jgi:hypothetical protein